MQPLKNLFDFYINSSIHVALNVMALSYISLIQFNVGIDIDVLAFIFFASITGYNFVKYFGLAKFHHRSLARWLKIIQIFSAICFVLLTYFTFQLKTVTLFHLLGFGLITFLYAIPFIPKRYFLDPEKNLRSISGLKIYVIAFVWSGVTVWIPLVNNDVEFNSDILITGIQRFLIVLVWMLPFEIRDLKYDSIKLSTIPQIIGMDLTKILGTIIALIFLLLQFFMMEIDKKSIIVAASVAFVSIAALIGATKTQSDYYSGFWVEAIPLFWLSLILVL